MRFCKEGQITFDEELLSYVGYSRQIDDSILNDHLINSFDQFGSLLHHAALHKNAAVVQQLIALGSDVDFVGRDGCTPFMYSVEMDCTAVFAKIFLKAKPNIDLVDDDGRSILQRALGTYNCNSPLIKLFVSKVKTKRTTPEALTTRLISAGCKMFEAAAFKDIKVMQCMLSNGIDINSTVSRGNALHRAATWEDVSMVKWLVENGANVNAINFIGNSVLIVAAEKRNEAILRILLERGADPNFKGSGSKSHALEAIFDDQLIVEDAVKCVELLLQHGATFQVTRFSWMSIRTVFDYALDWSSDITVKMLMCRLAMLNKLSSSTHKSFVFCNIESNCSKQPELEELYQFCLQVLEIKLFENLSLLDVLNAGDTRLNSLVRRKMFVSRVKTSIVKHKLSETHAFYYKTLMKRIDKAVRMVKLEDKAILVICKLFRCSYNQCHNFAREIVGYFKEYELECLVQV